MTAAPRKAAVVSHEKIVPKKEKINRAKLRAFPATDHTSRCPCRTPAASTYTAGRRGSKPTGANVSRIVLHERGILRLKLQFRRVKGAYTNPTPIGALSPLGQRRVFNACLKGAFSTLGSRARFQRLVQGRVFNAWFRGAFSTRRPAPFQPTCQAHHGSLAQPSGAIWHPQD